MDDVNQSSPTTNERLASLESKLANVTELQQQLVAQRQPQPPPELPLSNPSSSRSTKKRKSKQVEINVDDAHNDCGTNVIIMNEEGDRTDKGKAIQNETVVDHHLLSQPASGIPESVSSATPLNDAGKEASYRRCFYKFERMVTHRHCNCGPFVRHCFHPPARPRGRANPMPNFVPDLYSYKIFLEILINDVINMKVTRKKTHSYLQMLCHNFPHVAFKYFSHLSLHARARWCNQMLRSYAVHSGDPVVVPTYFQFSDATVTRQRLLQMLPQLAGAGAELDRFASFMGRDPVALELFSLLHKDRQLSWLRYSYKDFRRLESSVNHWPADLGLPTPYHPPRAPEPSVI